jgi:hypothetical protein
VAGDADADDQPIFQSVVLQVDLFDLHGVGNWFQR